MNRVSDKANTLRTQFEQLGALPVETAILQPAGTLLDLYGEDIRGRAYITSDALRGEQMLRPDFTVPVVQMHMERGADPARYTYAGTVFRRQEDDESRPNEYTQVGYEVFDRAEPISADAEVFALIASALGEAPVRASTGDIGILVAAVSALETSDARKAALLRHIWRPRKFRALLERFSKPAAPRDILSVDDPFANAGPEIGLRLKLDVQMRLDDLCADADVAPISKREIELLDALLNVRAMLPVALEQLRALAIDLPAIGSAVERLNARMVALKTRGVDVAKLEFETSYGRSLMEYYDGFVFGFYAETHADLPPIATGGRYDALTKQLGQGAEIPAVGGVIRPDLLIELEGGA
ncbi:ATP phosphoribosyltransferase regulatory subunit [Planktotalea frisia]|jgi:ATP phosphoribosyltransferase regulatory subunit|uniref:Histidine--tRNA ligase n=1 Tax=Planktotalea frisia TaxID=696762 RepID=A0A1L9NR98_9RHOB|nr:ATP phosphoribosyltransferase regulatory subunit [Planktotalea frisia]OJI91761.1 histidine--tRNA ligase [Planktotalea frisia]PZX21423.1 ATP phosphoribosyltransferase regulatory subunit [Planktotalea frisia]